MKLPFLFASLLYILAGVSPAAESARPNIVLIISDDQGYPDLGSLGLKPLQTPALDRIAAEGV